MAERVVVDAHDLRAVFHDEAGARADLYAVAAAQILDCPVMTGDPEFAAAERAGVSVPLAVTGHRSHMTVASGASCP